MEQSNEEHKPPLTKAAKLLAVVGFFMLLFFLAAVVGLPLPLSVVSFFFLTVAAPAALVFALLTAGLFKMVARLSKRPEAWPFFDVAVQTFILASLIGTGVFIVRFPGWLEGFYPAIRQEIEGHIASDVPVETRKDFLDALDRFWAWNVSFLLEPGEPPTEIEQQRVQDAVEKFRAAVTPECEDCNPELTHQEVRELTPLMNAVTLGTGSTALGTGEKIPSGAPAAETAPASSRAATGETSVPATAPVR
jgi:hypothetical protein